jgi:hypothetical protein
VLTPRTYPVAADTNVADLGSKPPGTEDPAGSAGAPGVAVDEAPVPVGFEVRVELEREVELATRLAFVVAFAVTGAPEGPVPLHAARVTDARSRAPMPAGAPTVRARCARSPAAHSPAAHSATARDTLHLLRILMHR